jgi:GTP-binding protein HflX
MPAGEQGRESLSELIELARSAGAEIAGTVFQLRDTADPATLVGRGKLDEIRAEATSPPCSSETSKKRQNAA